MDKELNYQATAPLAAISFPYCENKLSDMLLGFKM